MSDLQRNLDAIIEEWFEALPEPPEPSGGWDRLVQKVEQRLDEVSSTAGGHGQDAWFAPPAPPQPGEPGTDDSAASAVGEKKMSEPEEQPKKVSLKELAQRVSMAPSVRASAPSYGDGAKEGVPSTVRSRTSSVPDAGAAVSSGDFEEDSGLVDLAAVSKQAEGQGADEPKQAEAAAASAEQDEPQASDATSSAPSQTKEQRKGSMVPYVGGGVVAVLAIAAAFVMVVNKPGSAPGAAQLKAQAEQQTRIDAVRKPLVGGRAKSGAFNKGGKQENLDDLPSAIPAKADEEHVAEGDEAKGAAQKHETAGSFGKGKGAARRSRSSAPVSEAHGALRGGGGGGAKAKKLTESSTAVGGMQTNPNDLNGAMASAVGADQEKSEDKKTAERPKGPDPSTIPERPSQGAIQGALASVRGAAKACVAGMSAASRATITFGSSGAVKSVSVSGPAAGTSKAACIKNALRRANVGPFKRSSYTVGVTLRPSHPASSH